VCYNWQVGINAAVFDTFIELIQRKFDEQQFQTEKRERGFILNGCHLIVAP